MGDTFEDLFNYKKSKNRFIQKNEKLKLEFQLSKTITSQIPDQNDEIYILSDSKSDEEDVIYVNENDSFFESIDTKISLMAKSQPIQVVEEPLLTDDYASPTYIMIQGELMKHEFQRERPLYELADIVAKAKNLDKQRLTFTFLGETVNLSKTLNDLKIPNLSMFECITLSKDDPLFEKKEDSLPIDETPGIKVKIQGCSHKPMTYKMLKDEKIETVVDKYAADAKFDKTKFKYIFDGEYMNIQLTPLDFCIDCDFCVDVHPA